MSIAVLADVYTETRRLAIAGSIVAPGDFRLKKLIPSLQKSGEKAPIFTKVAEAVQRVVDSSEQTSAEAILDLGSLVSSILYTQGVTGAEGELKPIQPLSFAGGRTFVTARSIKPLLKAMSSTGSGRLETIRSAHQRDQFKDLRLIQPALAAIDDGYREIGDYVADSILPMYGEAILEELKSSFDLKGKQGHARRLRLIHKLDSQQSKELIQSALENGSKEVKIAAIECLGDSPEDLSYLLEQTRSRNQDVRAAALLALSRLDGPEVDAVLIKTLQGKDLGLLVRAAEVNQNKVLVENAQRLANEQLPTLAKQDDKDKQKEEVSRFLLLMRIAATNLTPNAEAFLIAVLQQQDTLAKIKSDPGGEDIALLAVDLLSKGSDKAVDYMIENRENLPPDSFGMIFTAARQSLSLSLLYDTFSDYLKPQKKKNAADATRFRILQECLVGGRRYFAVYGELPDELDDASEIDPRWVDLAIELNLPGIVYANPLAGHRATQEFLNKQWEQSAGKKKSHDAIAVALSMMQSQHPDAEDRILGKIAEMVKQKSGYEGYQWCHLASHLPASSLPKLEAIYADDKTPSALSKVLLDSMQTIRDRENTAQVDQ